MPSKRANAGFLRRASSLMETLERRACPATATLVGPTAPLQEGERAEFQIILSEPATKNESFVVQAIGQSARVDSDFQSLSRRPIYIRRGETSVSFGVDLYRDNVAESNETLSIRVKPIDRSRPALPPTTITIQDNEPLATLVGPSDPVSPGSNAVVTLQYAVPAPRAETFRISTSNETAVARTDYGSPSQRVLRILKGTTSASFSIPLTSRTSSSQRSFSVSLTAASRGASPPAPSRIVIAATQSTPPPPQPPTPQPPTPQPPTPQPPTPQPPTSVTVSVQDTSALEGNAGSSAAIFAVTLSASSTASVSVGYATSDGTATTADQDYTASSGTLTFAPGEISKTVSVQVRGDARFEPNESFVLTLSSPVNATIAQSVGRATIVNDDAAPVLPGLSISDATVMEPNTGSATATLTVRLSQAVANPVTVAYATVDGTATTQDQDYSSVTGALVFAPGETTKTLAIPVLGDLRPEADETLTVRLSSPLNATLTKADGVVTIQNDDSHAIPRLTIADAVVTEGNSGAIAAAFLVTLSNASASVVTVTYSTSDLTATAASGDYVRTSGMLTFSPGQVQQTVSVLVNGDTLAEEDEVFFVSLSDPTNAEFSAANASVGTIRNDDAGLNAWTIMVYMTGDDLNNDARDDINEMEYALSQLPASVNITVSWDQWAGGGISAWGTGNGSQPAWTSYGRAVLQPDTTPSANPNAIVTPFDIRPSDRNTGDGSTLWDFITWSVTAVPAERYLLMMWGHGQGLIGSNSDVEAGSDELSLTEMASVLSSPGVPSIDILGYDNCLMGMVEVAHSLHQNVTGFFVGSQELVPAYGHDYTTVFSSLRQNPYAVTTEAVARGVVTSFENQRQAKIAGGDLRLVVFNSNYSAIRSNALPTLASALQSFVLTTRSYSQLDWTIARIWATSVRSYGGKTFGDLGQYLDNISLKSSLPAASRLAAATARNALNAAVLQRTVDPWASNGLSVYLRADGMFDGRYYSDAPLFISATRWAEFIYMLTVSA
jgi:hypothetical protein